MEEDFKNIEKKKKLKLKTILVVICVLILLILIGVVYANISKSQDNDKCNNSVNSRRQDDIIDKKPIIYLYPQTETKVTVKLGKEKNLLYTYPKYQNYWEVLAKPNGDLIDQKSGRSQYALYWEGKNIKSYNKLEGKEGFIVKGEDTIKFLEEKLEILGLTEREANEFIIYWLPKMESNTYNYIRFQTKEEIEENMPLTITPTPDTIIRVMMEFKPLQEKIEVKEQKLTTPKREGFVAVEWGGTKIQ